MQTTTTYRRSVRSVLDGLVLASGAVATAFGILAAAHIAFSAVQLAIGITA
jgi:hypothetical protein